MKIIIVMLNLFQHLFALFRGSRNEFGMTWNSKGFSVVEVILAGAMFMTFATFAATAVLQGFDVNRLGAEETIASQFAGEGIEAVKSIKNQAYANLVNSSGTGIVRTGGVWTFTAAPPNNTLTHNSTDNYIRTIKLESVNRDGAGNIVIPPAGTLDPDTKKITSTVNWNFNLSRPESAVLTTYLSDWRKPISNIARGGMLVYGDGGSTSDAIQYKILDGAGTWNSAALAADIDSSTDRYLLAARVFASATRNEKILISRHYNGTTQYIYAQVFDGTAWGNVNLLSSWAAVSYLDVRNFDGAYLNNGNFMVIYSDNTATPKFKTWNGSVWSTASGVAGAATQNIGDIPTYIVLRDRPGTNEAMAVFFDQNASSDTNTQYFYIGSNNTYETADWTLHTEHMIQAPTNTKEHISFAWSRQSSLKGALVFVDSSTTLRLKIWTADGAGGGSWSAYAASGASVGNTGGISISGRFGAEEFIACQKDTNSDIYCFRANTTPSWTTPAGNILTTNSDSGIQRSHDAQFEATLGSEALSVYSDNTTSPKYRLYTASSNSFGAETNLLSVALGGVLKSVSLRPLEDNNDIMILMGDANLDLYSVVWDGSTNAAYTTPLGKARTAHGINGALTTAYWYDFAWDRF